MEKIFLIICLIFSVSPLFSQSFALPELPDTTNYGRYTSRTMHLLQSGITEKRNTVKILVYGQSINPTFVTGKPYLTQ